MEATTHKGYVEEKQRLDYIKEILLEEREALSRKSYDGLSEEVKPHMVYMDEQIYIGKASLMDFEREEGMLITDWRAPISTLYYDRNIGSVDYDCPGGNIHGDLLLKRNYKIEDGQLEKIIDIDVSAIDEMLLEALEDKKDTKLKDIVSTIQSEQNKIIRADLMKSLIIQGVAGSGKTTIALHRIAYLIYTYQHVYRPDEFMIIAPNKLFLQYIEDMLPELGVEDVEQTTMETLAKDILLEEFYINERDEKLKKIIEYEQDKELVTTLRDISGIKTNHTAYHKQEIINIHLEQQSRIKNMKKNFTKLMNGYFKEPKKSILRYYEQFLMREDLLNGLLEDRAHLLEAFKIMSKDIRTQKLVEIEDLPALMYLKHRLKGAEEMGKIKHIVIDEGQDFGSFQFFVLKTIMKEATFTILGDIAQGINYHRGTSEWNTILQEVFEEQCQIKYLQQSYRTTVEIMNAANQVIEKVGDENIILATPVLRHGSQVEKIKKDSYEEILDAIDKAIDEFKTNYNSIAIICKNNQLCEKMYNQFRERGINVQWLKDKDAEYSEQIVLLPSYLAKGLEFDCVIIPDGKKNNYILNKLDGMLLYVCMTRALHELKIYYEKECSDLLA